MLLVPFNLLVGMVFWNYILTVRTDPGTTPKGWQPDLRSSEGYEVKKLTGAPRYCRTCSRYKPPRAHHCRQCKKCVLRMDHHCPWVNNCVGHFNYGHFIRFLFYVDVACSYHLAMVSTRTWQAMTANGYFAEPSTGELVFMILNYAACVPVILLVGGFSIYHFYCVSSNQTTIEGWEKDKVATLLKFPYHLGTWTNVRAVLGERAWLWCWPQRMRGSGLSFPVAEGTDRDRDHGSSMRHENGWSSTDADIDEGGTSGSRGGARLRAVEEEGEIASFAFRPALDCILTLLSPFSDPDIQFVWPPKEPGIYKDRSLAAASALQSRLQGSPWTYGNDGPNPALRTRNQSNHPPYHPAYQPPRNDSNDPDRQFDHEYDDSTSSSPSRASSDYDVDQSLGRDVRMRRGSEGWEVRPMTNEEIVARYARSRGIQRAEDEEVVPLDLEQENGWDLDLPDSMAEHEGDFVSIAPSRYNTYIPETPDSSEDEALGTHVATFADE
ncbi:Palmitoyltransferase [Ceratobasidium sp. 370]|nr:Palmitoyltransferase [Ceratobasidium sp. 370]